MSTLRTLGCLGLLMLVSLGLLFVSANRDVNLFWQWTAWIFSTVFLGCAGWLGLAAWRTSITHGR